MTKIYFLMTQYLGKISIAHLSPASPQTLLEAGASKIESLTILEMVEGG